MGKEKKHKNNWVKRRHARVFAFLRIIMRPYCRIRYNFTAQRCKLPQQPYFIVSNHQAVLDQFFLSLSFAFPIYFIATDDIFNLRISPLITYLVAPIPKSKSFTDVSAIMNTFRVIKEGGVVGVCPEGNRTMSGGQWEMTDAIAKLAKRLKVPLIIHNVVGGYGADPRWGRSVRRGRVRGVIKRIISTEELSEMSVEQLFEVIKEGLKVDDTALGIPFKSRRRAEYIERALYICPECGSVSSICSKGSKFRCAHCGMTAEYTEKLKISPPVGERKFDRILEWYEWEKEEIAKKISGGGSVSDSGIIFRESVKCKRKITLDGDRVTMDSRNLIISGKKGESVYPIKDITSVTMLGKRKFNFYYNGKILQIKGGKRFCAIKYVHIFDGLCASDGEVDK